MPPSCALLGGFANRCTGCVAMTTLWKCMPSGKPPDPPHAARMPHTHTTLRMPAKTPLVGAAIKSTRLLRAPFHFVHTAGVL